jgi:hypothetical protein
LLTLTHSISRKFSLWRSNIQNILGASSLTIWNCNNLYSFGGIICFWRNTDDLLNDFNAINDFSVWSINDRYLGVCSTYNDGLKSFNFWRFRIGVWRIYRLG